MTAFEDFMKHAEVEEAYHLGRQKYLEYQNLTKTIIENEIEKKAEELEITVDYYIAEFM